MSKPKRPRDTNRLAYTVVQESLSRFERRQKKKETTKQKQDEVEKIER